MTSSSAASSVSDGRKACASARFLTCSAVWLVRVSSSNVKWGERFM